MKFQREIPSAENHRKLSISDFLAGKEEVKRMRLLYILKEFPVISQTFVLNEIISLVERGHSIRIISLLKPKSTIVENKELKKIVNYVDVKKKQRAREKIQIILKALFFRKNGLSLKEMQFLYREYAWRPPEEADCASMPRCSFVNFISIALMAKAFGPEAIYCHFGNTAKYFIKIAQWLRIPLITYFHGYDFANLVRAGIDYSILFSKGSIFFTNSRFSKRRLIKLGVSEDKIEVIGYGIDTDKIKSVPRKPGKSVDLITISRLVEKKGLQYSIAAVGKCLHTFPNIKYNIIGEGPLKSQLQDLIRKKRLKKSVFLLGARPHEEALKFLYNSHLFILASVTAPSGDSEGLGVALLEAQASGMPVIATLHNGFNESVNNGYSGYLVPERDTQALSDKLEYLIRHPEKWKEMGKCGHKHVEKYYKREYITDKIEYYIDWVINKQKRISFQKKLKVQKAVIQNKVKNAVITGIPRSGTSLFAAIITSLPNCICLNEILYDPSTLERDFAAIRHRVVNKKPVANKYQTAKAAYYATNTPFGETVVEKRIDRAFDRNAVICSKINIPYIQSLPTILKKNFFVIAIIRHPAYTIASWNTPKCRFLPEYDLVSKEMHRRYAHFNFKRQGNFERQMELWILYARTLFEFYERKKIKIFKYEEFVTSPRLITDFFMKEFHLEATMKEPFFKNMNSDKHYCNQGVDMEQIHKIVRFMYPAEELFSKWYVIN